MKRDLKLIYPVFAERIRKSVFRLWKSGCEAKAGTNAPNVCARRRNDSRQFSTIYRLEFKPDNNPYESQHTERSFDENVTCALPRTRLASGYPLVRESVANHPS